MTAPLPVPPRPKWYRESGVIKCDTCDGRGSIWNGRGLGGNDPDSWDIACEDCDGAGHFACQTCGFATPVAGYDCLVCDTVYSLGQEDRASVTPEQLAAAFSACLGAAQVEDAT